MWHPWRELRSLDRLIFEQVDLPSGDAWWSPRHEVILLRPGLLQVERRCALAHELGHRRLEHSGQCSYSDAERQHRRAEIAADHWAARRLITEESLADVLVWTDDRDEAAEDLWVTRRVLDVRLEHIHPGERLRIARRVEDRETGERTTRGGRRDDAGRAGRGM